MHKDAVDFYLTKCIEWLMTNAMRIARLGESIVFGLLPGAHWINGEADAGENYDI